MRHLFSNSALAIALLISSPAVTLASEASISALKAQGKQGAIPTINLALGQGVTLSFLETRERIYKVWVDNSRVSVSPDSALESGAKVLHLAQQGAEKGSTRLTLTTLEGGPGGKQRLYTFNVQLSARPTATILSIQPQSTPPPTPVLTATGAQGGIGAIESGLRSAIAQGKIQANSSLHQALQSFLVLTRQGVPVAAAAQQTGVRPEVLYKLIQVGTQAKPPKAVPAARPPASRPSVTPKPAAPKAPDFKLPDNQPIQQVKVSPPKPSAEVRSVTASKPQPKFPPQQSKRVRPSVKVAPKATSKKVATPAVAAPKRSLSQSSSVRPTPALAPLNTPTGVVQANAILRGLGIARNKGQIGYQTSMWRKVQDLVYLLRLGKSKEQAAERAGVPLKVVNQLLVWGGAAPSAPVVEAQSTQTSQVSN